MKQGITIALIGQPNCGKTTLINSILGTNLKVGNFAGVTVEKTQASMHKNGIDITIVDLPGVYSLDDYAKDSQIVKDFLLNEQYDIILNVIDSTNLERGLLLTTELVELGFKIVVALNMDDEAQKYGILINAQELSILLGIRCIKISASKQQGLDTLITQTIKRSNGTKQTSKFFYSDNIELLTDNLAEFLDKHNFNYKNIPNKTAAILLLKQDKSIYKYIHEDPIYFEITPKLNSALNTIYELYNCDLDELVAEARSSFARGAFLECAKLSKKRDISLTQTIDKILLNKYLGMPIFLLMMWLLFQLVFTIGSIPADIIENCFEALSDFAKQNIQNETAKSLIIDGIIGGVGSVIGFLPNIIILFFGIAMLETTGYMARATFLLDGFLHKFGLHGKSFIPLVTGFGCSVPAYMAARTLKNEKDRLLTMFIIGFMSCGARLPIYVLFAGAFFSENYAGSALFGIYITGALLGLLAAKILRKTIFNGKDEPFVMDMPKYRMPSVKLIWFTVYSKSFAYLKKAGGYILLLSIFIWFIGSYPKDESLSASYSIKIQNVQTKEEKKSLSAELSKIELENTYLGVVGKAIEPIFEPLGFDWKMSVATLSGLTAKEVIVSTLSVLYSIDSDDNENLTNEIRQNIPFESACAFIVFVMLYLPCLAATAVFAKEAGKIKYTAYLAIFTFTTAWLCAFIVYNCVKLFV